MKGDGTMIVLTKEFFEKLYGQVENAIDEEIEEYLEEWGVKWHEREEAKECARNEIMRDMPGLRDLLVAIEDMTI